MDNNLINDYYNLDLNDKREAITNELIRIALLIKNIENGSIDFEDLEIKKYNKILDSDITEEDFLTCIYDDIFKIEKELFKIIGTMSK